VRKFVTLFAALALLSGSLHRIRVRHFERAGLVLGVAKVVAAGLAPIAAVTGAITCVVGLVTRAPLTVLMGLAGAALSAQYTAGVLHARGDLERAFGADWEARIPPALRTRLLSRRWSWLAPRPPAVQQIRDIPFAIVPLPPSGPAGDRPIYCDLWLPPDGTQRTGLGIIYLHGSAWYFGDKDQGTRPFFRHLAAQGHVIMDVAYRMCPETDFRGMAGDAKRAIAWLKEHAGEHGVDPQRIVLSGGSAGGHLALLAAYSATEEALRPADLAGRDLSVRAVFAYYPPSDLLAMDEFYGWQGRKTETLATLEGPLVPPGPGATIRQRQEFVRLQARRLSQLPQHMFGGYPQDVPDAYRLASPSSHVGPHCPPTLLIHGSHDVLVPVAATRALAQSLRNAGVLIDYLELPATEHAFDLLVPRFSPPAQAALYEVERFLALMI
jgi:acetyl esterase/lipase